MNIKKLLFAVGILALAAVAAGAQTIFTVGVIDIQRVYTNFLQDSQGVRELEALRSEIEQELTERAEEIQRLESELVEAREEDNRREVLRLQNELELLRENYDEYRRIQQDRLERRRRQLTQGDRQFLADLQRAVEFVAVGRGYTLIMNMDEQGLIWWSPEVDITDDVLARLRQRS
jgi:outer membrane protein